LAIRGLNDIGVDDAESAHVCKSNQGGVGDDDRYYPGCTNKPTEDVVGRV
jgi:hypothetical protein